MFLSWISLLTASISTFISSKMSSLDTISGLDSNRRLERLYMEDRVLPGIPNCGKVRTEDMI